MVYPFCRACEQTFVTKPNPCSTRVWPRAIIGLVRLMGSQDTGAGVARAIGNFWLGCGRGAGLSRDSLEKRPRTRPGRVPDASRTIGFEETDASRMHPQLFLSALYGGAAASCAAGARMYRRGCNAPPTCAARGGGAPQEFQFIIPLRS
eukprot:gene15416-biopygen21710